MLGFPTQGMLTFTQHTTQLSECNGRTTRNHCAGSCHAVPMALLQPPSVLKQGQTRRIDPRPPLPLGVFPQKRSVRLFDLTQITLNDASRSLNHSLDCAPPPGSCPCPPHSPLPPIVISRLTTTDSALRHRYTDLAPFVLRTEKVDILHPRRLLPHSQSLPEAASLTFTRSSIQ